MKGIRIREDANGLRCELIEDKPFSDPIVEKVKIAKCSPDGTYDFETGALIALMKMCGVDKVVRACNEAFSEDTFKTYATKYERELNELKKDSDKVIDELIEENEKLKSDKDKSWKNYQRNIQKKQDRINELEIAYKACNDDEAKLVEYYQREIKKFEEENKKLKGNIDELFESDKYAKSQVGKLSFEKHRLEEEIEKLQHEYNLCLNSENALKYTTDSLNKSVAKLNKAIEGYKNDLYNTAKRCKEFEEENEKLKLDCEKLQHGYNDMMFCGGRQNGKQYTVLVDMFKKLDQKKVDAAYKEAYGKRVVWCTSQSSTRDMLDSLIDSCKYAILTDKDGTKIEKWTGISEFTWEIKVPTKREKMWDRIFKSHKTNDVIIEVKKEDVTTFLQEIQNRIPEITWASGEKIFKTKYTIVDIYGELETCDRIYFRLRRDSELSYSSDPDIYLYTDLEHIPYLSPSQEDSNLRDDLVNKINLISKEFNTK